MVYPGYAKIFKKYLRFLIKLYQMVSFSKDNHNFEKLAKLPKSPNWLKSQNCCIIFWKSLKFKIFSRIRNTLFSNSDLGHFLSDTKCPPTGSYEPNQHAVDVQKSINSKNLVTVNCLQRERCTAEQFDKNSKPVIENLKKEMKKDKKHKGTIRKHIR